MQLQELTHLVMEQAREKGFGVTAQEVNIPEKFTLLHSEISEAFEAYRHKNIDDKDGLCEELGDVLQRLVHLAALLEVDLEQSLVQKIEKNKSRQWNWENMNESHSS